MPLVGLLGKSIINMYRAMSGGEISKEETTRTPEEKEGRHQQMSYQMAGGITNSRTPYVSQTSTEGDIRAV